jgi:hypothetical protein
MKTLVAIAALFCGTLSSLGQGTVSFSGGGTGATRISTNSAIGGATTGFTGLNSQGYTYYYALFVADATVTSAGSLTATGVLDPTLSAGWSLAQWSAGNPAGIVGGVYATNSNAVGRFTGNPTTDFVLVSGRATGSSASFMVVGWSSQVAGQDWNAAKAWIDTLISTSSAPGIGWVGASSVASSVPLGGGVIPVGLIFGAAPGEIGGFVLQIQPIPEPGTLALAGLGAATFLIFRDRRRITS